VIVVRLLTTARRNAFLQLDDLEAALALGLTV
jgi:hypothetical protein